MDTNLGSKVGYWGFYSVICLSFLGIPFTLLIEAQPAFYPILGMAALAGTLLGVLLAPLIGWKCRRFGLFKALGIGVLTPFGGAFAGSWFLLFLVAMSTD